MSSFPVVLTVILAATAAAQQAKTLPNTPASKAFTNAAALKYAKAPCIGQYDHSVTVATLTRHGFDTLYKQYIAEFDTMKPMGLVYATGKQSSSYWVVSLFNRRSTISYAELQNGKGHSYTCALRP